MAVPLWGTGRLRRVARAPAQILSSRLALAHCGRYADRAAVYSFSTLNERGWTTNHESRVQIWPWSTEEIRANRSSEVRDTQLHHIQSTPKLPASMHDGPFIADLEVHGAVACLRVSFFAEQVESCRIENCVIAMVLLLVGSTCFTVRL